MKIDLGSLRQRIGTISIILLFTLMPACASTGGAEAAGEGDISVRVHNNLVPSTTVSISAHSEATGRTLLGTVMPGAEQTFAYRPVVSSGTYRLVADAPGPGGQLVSRPIAFPEGGSASVRWDLTNNSVVEQ